MGVKAEMGCDGRTLANSVAQGLQLYQPGKPVSEVVGALDLEESAMVTLASHEKPSGSSQNSQKAVDAMARVVDGLARYPDDNGFALKTALSARHGIAAYGMPGHLRVSTGTKAGNQQFTEALSVVLKGIADGG